MSENDIRPSSEANMTRWFYNKYAGVRYSLVAPNMFVHWRNEMDIFGLRKSGYSDEVEIKHSVTDFKADFKKTTLVKCEEYTPEKTFRLCKFYYCNKCQGTGKQLISGDPCGHWQNYGKRTYKDMNKHEAIAGGLGTANYFSFFVPEYLADQIAIPDYAGLYVCSDSDTGLCRIKEVKRPSILHKNKLTEAQVTKVAMKMATRFWTGASTDD